MPNIYVWWNKVRDIFAWNTPIRKVYSWTNIVRQRIVETFFSTNQIAQNSATQGWNKFYFNWSLSVNWSWELTWRKNVDWSGYEWNWSFTRQYYWWPFQLKVRASGWNFYNNDVFIGTDWPSWRNWQIVAWTNWDSLFLINWVSQWAPFAQNGASYVDVQVNYDWNWNYSCWDSKSWNWRYWTWGRPDRLGLWIRAFSSSPYPENPAKVNYIYYNI